MEASEACAWIHTCASSRALPPQGHLGRRQDEPALWKQLRAGLWLAGAAPCSGRGYHRPLPRAFPTALSEPLLASPGSAMEHPTPSPSRLRWKAHSTGNKAAGQTTPLYLPQIWPQPAARGKEHCERTLNYGCSFSWRLSFWQEV